jgi:hypothetical protein
MDYKFHFYPWFLDDSYTLESDEIIRKETRDYFDKIKENSYIQKNYKDLCFTD